MLFRSSVSRQTAETSITLSLNIDGSGVAQIETGVGFFNHMLTLLAKHSLMDLTVDAQGDIDVDYHHTVEDVGICFGQALAQAIGDKAGINRYGSISLPMEETLVTSAVDLSGRIAYVYKVSYPSEKIGDFDTELVQVFWRSEEHTSELQSRRNLVCRLLLEKKKNNTHYSRYRDICTPRNMTTH